MNDRIYSSLTVESLSYTWRQLAQRIGVDIEYVGMTSSIMGVPLLYTQPECVQSSQPSIIVVPCVDDAWRRLLEREANDLVWLAIADVIPPGVDLSFFDSVPVVFWGAGYEDKHKPFVEQQKDGTVVFYADILATIFFMLSRWEETVVPIRDQHDRFPATASVAYKQGFLDRPIVDQYALVLQAWLKVLVPSWTPQPGQFSVKLSHDIDFARSVSLRTLGGDILQRRSPAKALQTALQIISPQKDPFLRGCYELAGISERNGFQSAFYFMSAQRSTYDNGYDPRARSLQHCIYELHQRGHETGFHPGYTTLHNVERFMAEKYRMDEALGQAHYGGRQHFLRFSVPHTWRLWQQAGLAYDSTLGYADNEGFRCGTCHPYQPFDFEYDRPLNILEVPLIVMDTTLRFYRGLTPEEARERILTLVKRCKEVNGTFVLLWHSTSLYGDWKPWAEMYKNIVSWLGNDMRTG